MKSPFDPFDNWDELDMLHDASLRQGGWQDPFQNPDDPQDRRLDAFENSIEGTIVPPSQCPGEISPPLEPDYGGIEAVNQANKEEMRVQGPESEGPPPIIERYQNYYVGPLPPQLPKRPPYGRTSIFGGGGHGFRSPLDRPYFPWRGLRVSGQGIRYCPEKGLIPRSECYNCEHYDPDPDNEGENCSLLRGYSDNSEE